MQKRNVIIRTLAATAAVSVLAGLPFHGPAASADSGLAYEAVVEPPPPTSQFVAIANPDVVLDDFTPPPPRADRSVAASSSLRVAGSGRAQGYGGADDFKAGPGCSIQCITSGIAYARGVGARLDVKTDTPATIWIIVWDGDGYHKMVNSSAGQTSFHFTFDDLEPGHTYQAMAAAEDGQGYTSHAYGSFQTLNRYVEISLSGAEVSAHAFSPSYFSKSIWVNGGWLEQYDAGPMELQGSSLSWGDNVIMLSNVGRYLDLALQLSEYDADPDDLCEADGELLAPTLGPASCGYFAFAELQEGDNDLDERPDDATSWTEHTLHRTLMLPGGALPPGYGSPLDFTVEVSLHVIYQ